MNTFWKNKKVLVAGGTGFLGSHLVSRLRTLGASVCAAGKTECDFTQLKDTLALFKIQQPEIMIHAAAYYGGLAMTLKEPGKLFFENAVMSANLFEASRLQGVKKFVAIGATCSYPGASQGALKEDELWSGPMHDSVSAYGAVKRMLQVQGEAYRKQYSLSSIYVVPATLYGPGDSFDEYRAHVVGDLIRKFHQAKMTSERRVVLWGSGNSVREFLFIDDCVEGILLAAERYDESTALNIGTGVGTSIRDLAETISSVTQFKGTIFWDANRPDGQPVKVLNIEKMKGLLQWQPKTDLKKGIAVTVEWYESQSKYLHRKVA